MPTLRTVTVKSSGGDYTSLNAAEAGEQGDLPTLDRQLDIACYAMVDSSGCYVDGWTTDATRYIRIYTPAGEGHSGVYTESKYVLTGSADGGTSSLKTTEDYLRIEGLQVKRSANYVTYLAPASTASDVRVDRCIINVLGAAIYAAVYTTGGASSVLSLTNCLVQRGENVTNYTIWEVGSSSGRVLNIENCTVIGASAGSGIVNNYGSPTINVKNCYVSAGTPYSSVITRTTCAHSTSGTFSGSTANVAHSTANFTSVTSGSEDYHLVSGSALIDVGTDLSSDFTTDIDGATRSGTWDIGADEYSGGGGPTYRAHVIGGSLV